MVYVTPTEDMVVRAGQHVGGDGKVYHHFLAHWRDAWDVSRSHHQCARYADKVYAESKHY